MQDAKNFFRLVGGAATFGISLAELYDPDDQGNHDVVPTSVAFTLLAYLGLGIFVMAAIMLLSRGECFSAEWRKEAAKNQVYASGLAFITSAFIVGQTSSRMDQNGDLVVDDVGTILGGLPGGMFLGLSLLKLAEFCCGMAELCTKQDSQGYNGVGEDFESGQAGDSDDTVKDIKEREQMSIIGFISVGFSIALSCISFWNYECKLELDTDSTGNYTCETGPGKPSPASVGVMTAWGVGLLIGAAGLAFIAQGFLLHFFAPEADASRKRGHAGIGITVALVLYVSLSMFSMALGRDFSKEHYLEGFLASNMLYYTSLLFGFMGVVQFEDFNGVHEKTSGKRVIAGEVHAFAAVMLGAFCTSAIWGSDILFNKDVVPGGNKVMELAVYAILTVLVLSGHTLFVKLVEMILIPEFRACGCYTDALGNTDEVFDIASKRTESTLSLALISAVCIGQNKWELSIGFLFVIACAARFIGYWQRYIPEPKEGDLRRKKQESCTDWLKRRLERLRVVVWDDRVPNLVSAIQDGTKIGYNAEETDEKAPAKGVLLGIVALTAATVFASVFVFRDGEPVPAGKEGLRTWEFIMWILLCVHLLLTLGNVVIGFCNPNFYFHAGTIPPLRFLVSSFCLVVFSASMGAYPLQDGLYQYTVPLVLSLVVYDSSSEGLF